MSSELAWVEEQRGKLREQSDALAKLGAMAASQPEGLQTASVRITLPEMADLTRVEIDAKLATVEARTETRFVELSGKIDRLTEIVTETRSDTKGTRLAVIITAIASVLAILGVVLAAQGNMLSAFQAGLAAVQAAPHH